MPKKVIFATLSCAALMSLSGMAYNNIRASIPTPERQSKTATVQRTWNPAVFATAASTKTVSRADAPVFDLPYSDNFSNGDATKSNYTFIDVDNDGIVYAESNVTNRWFWKADESLIQHCVDRENPVPGNDWLMTPAIHFDGRHIYNISIVVNMGAYSNLRLTVGKSLDPADHTEILDLNGIYDGWMTAYNTDFTVDGEGDYYIGLYNYSTAEGFYFNLFSIDITQGDSSEVPVAPSNLKVVPAENGALSAEISFTAPAKLVNGAELTDEYEVCIERNGEPIASVTCTPGENATYTDDIVPACGEYEYTVYGEIDEEAGQSVSVRAWIGTDAPKAPSLTSLHTVNRNMDVYLEWTPVTESAHGGYFNADDVTYVIYRGYNRSRMEPIASGIKETNFTDTEISEILNGYQQGYFYGVAAANEAGAALSTADIVAVGEPYKLPQVESFPNGYFDIEPWLTDPISGSFSWSCITTADGMDGHDGDNGLTRFYDYYGGWDLTDSRLKSPVFDIQGTENPTLSFWMFHWQDYTVNYEPTTGMFPEISVDGGEWQPLSDLILAAYETYGWVEHKFSLKDFKDAETVQFAFRGQTYTNWMYFYLDEIRVEDTPDYDVAITEFWGSSNFNIDDTGSWQIEVYNRGLKDAEGVSIEILMDGKTIWSISDEYIPVGGSENYAGGHTFNATETGFHVISARVVFEADGNLANNNSTELGVMVNGSYYPTVEGLAAEINEASHANITWCAPQLPDPSATIVDGAEDYESWLISGFGQWLTIDRDRLGSGYFLELPYKWPNCEVNQAFIIWEAEEELVENFPNLIPYSGDKCFLSWLANASYGWDDPVNDDFLVSPEVAGGTKVKFMVKGIGTEDNNETFEVMYSTNGRDADSFTVILSSVATKDWTPVEVELPEDARYFAIHYTASFQYGLMVDDIEYTPVTGSLKLEGYDVFRNGVKINDDIVTETNFVDLAPEAGENAYSVAALYDRGTSNACDPVSVFMTSGIVDEAVDDVKIMTSDGTLTVTTSAPVSVKIFNISGSAVYNGVVSGARSFTLAHGIYIVNYGMKAVKIVL